jgi:protein-S-isoprenylcysteine O-methyltransferase Ste14
MGQTEERDAAAVRVFPPGVPLLAIVLGIGLNYLLPLGLGDVVGAAVRIGVGAAILLAAVFGLGLPAVILMRRSGQSEKPWTPTTAILDRGPFRITRNPMYLQMVLGCIGLAILLANGWILILTPLCAWVLHRFAVLPEEAYLERKFGDRYRSYKARVHRWI